MLGSYLKKKFGKNKEVPLAEQFFSSLRIGLHSTIEVNTIDWFVLQESLNKSMVLPTSNLSVLAIGESKVDDDVIYRVYVEDNDGNEFVLQLFCANDRGTVAVSDAMLFKQTVSKIPQSEEAWDEALKTIGFNTLELDDNTYQRVWSDDHEGQVDLLEFDEKIVQPHKTSDYVNNYMLYSRDIEGLGGTETELLLVGVEETEETAEITMSVGLPIPLSNINVQ